MIHLNAPGVVVLLQFCYSWGTHTTFEVIIKYTSDPSWHTFIHTHTQRENRAMCFASQALCTSPKLLRRRFLHPAWRFTVHSFGAKQICWALTSPRGQPQKSCSPLLCWIIGRSKEMGVVCWDSRGMEGVKLMFSIVPNPFRAFCASISVFLYRSRDTNNLTTTGILGRPYMYIESFEKSPTRNTLPDGITTPSSIHALTHTHIHIMYIYTYVEMSTERTRFLVFALCLAKNRVDEALFPVLYSIQTPHPRTVRHEPLPSREWGPQVFIHTKRRS